MAVAELGCTYASLILHDDGIPITAEKIFALVRAANLNVESYWQSFFAKLADKRSIDDLILTAGSGGCAAPAVAVAVSAGGSSIPAASAAVEEKKEVPKEDSDDDMGFSLFD